MPDLPVAAPDHAETLIVQGRTFASNVRTHAARSPEGIAQMIEDLADLAAALLAERQQDKERIERLLAALRKGDEQVSALHDELYAALGDKDVPDWVKLGLEAVNVEVWKAHEILRAALAVEEEEK